LIAAWATDGVRLLLPGGIAESLELAIDWRVLAFTLTVSIATALVCGFAPARHALRIDVAAALRERRSDGGSAAARLGGSLVAAQTAFALAVVVGAGLLARTLYQLSFVHPGFETDSVVIADVDPGAREYRDERLAMYFRDAIDRLRATPGVGNVTLLQFSFLTNAQTTGTIDVPGYIPASDADRFVRIYQVGPRFFTTLGLTLRSGRDFDDRDFAGAPRVAAISETAARRFFGDGDPVGRTIRGDASWGELRIIAVVRDARYNTLRDVPAATVFVPYTIARRARMTFAARVDGGESGQAAVLAALRSIDSQVPIQITALSTLMSQSLGQERLLATIATFFAASSLFLIALGLYGVMSFWVTQRTSEIGIRLALGARRSQVARSALAGPIRCVFAGTGLGLLIVFAGARLLERLLYGIAPHDVATVVGAIVVMALVASGAAIAPALRASRIDPALTLRN
jgi:putative ABC transport system permease protein